jgi:hypothetical protein
MDCLEVLDISSSSKDITTKLFTINKLKERITNFNNRELYIIDSKYSFDISSMIIKKDCILLKLDFIRSIIYENNIYLLDVKKPEFDTIKNKLYDILSNFSTGLSEKGLQGLASPSFRALDNSRKFHLYFIDFLFTEICNYFDNLINIITPRICHSNELIRNGTYVYKDFISLQSELLNLEYRIKELKNMTDELLDNKDELREMCFDTNDELTDNTEEMIENYSLKFQDLDNDVSRLTREMDNVQKLVNIDLAKKRNSYAVFSIYISIISASISLGSFIGSMFGMNLKNNIEHSNVAFIITFILAVIIILLSIKCQIVHFIKFQ